MVVWAQSLALALPHASGTAKKNQLKNESELNDPWGRWDLVRVACLAGGLPGCAQVMFAGIVAIGVVIIFISVTLLASK